jgi:hypothetical protein
MAMMSSLVSGGDGSQFALDALPRLGLDGVHQHVMAAYEQHDQGIRLLERRDKGERLGLGDLGGQQAAEDAFGAARRHLQQAREALKARLDQPEWQTLAGQLDERGRQSPQSFDEHRRRLAQYLADNRIPPAGALEIMQHYDEVAGGVRTGGLHQAMLSLHEQLGQADQQLTAEHNFGRETRSPLEWWQWLIIIAIIGIAVAVLLACLFWAGCSWIYAIWIAIGDGAVFIGFSF